MKKDLLNFVCCPKCSADFNLKIEEEIKGDIKKGALICLDCKQQYNITNFIPRFVPDDGYTKSFSFQWNKFKQTQLDEYWQIDLSKKRFFEETRWKDDLSGELICEVGCGMGRFTQHAASTNANIISFDYSKSVDAAYDNNKELENVNFIQADLNFLPFKKKIFDKIFCLGVLQHCPDPKKAFFNLLPYGKDKSNIVADIYKKPSHPFENYYYLRYFTKGRNPEKLFRYVSLYFSFIYFFTGIIYKIFGSAISSRAARFFCIVDYRGQLQIKDKKKMKELCLTDTFDKLSPLYDYPHTIKQVNKWFENITHANLEINTGYNGIEIHLDL